MTGSPADNVLKPINPELVKGGILPYHSAVRLANKAFEKYHVGINERLSDNFTIIVSISVDDLGTRIGMQKINPDDDNHLEIAYEKAFVKALQAFGIGEDINVGDDYVQTIDLFPDNKVVLSLNFQEKLKAVKEYFKASDELMDSYVIEWANKVMGSTLRGIIDINDRNCESFLKWVKINKVPNYKK